MAYDSATMTWKFHVNSKQFSGTGTYDVVPIPDDTNAYRINGCTGGFEIK
jgi:hypothetical protein